jgi:hypothetical protein
MADGFTQTSMQLGGQIVGRRAVKGGDRDFGALVRTLPQDFDLLFYGGMFEATFIQGHAGGGSQPALCLRRWLLDGGRHRAQWGRG